MSDLAVPPQLPTSEAEVITRLKNPPKNFEVVMRAETDTQSSVRSWVKLSYDFKGKITGFGRWLSAIAQDVWQAGGVVTQFSISPVAGLRPANDDPDDYTPTGNWRGIGVTVNIKTRVELQRDAAGWSEAVREVVARIKK